MLDAEGDSLPLVAIRLQLHAIADALVVQPVVDAHGVDAVAEPLLFNSVIRRRFQCAKNGRVARIFLVRAAFITDIICVIISLLESNH